MIKAENYSMKYFNLSSISFLILGLVGCATPAPKAIIFPEMKVGDCADGSERSPSALCGSQIGDKEKYQKWEAVMSKFEKFTAATDASKGKGLTNAALYVMDEKNPFREKSPESFWYPGQIVSFYQPAGKFGSANKGGTAVQATPTRVYLTSEGKIAYMAFDGQAVSLLEYSAGDRAYSKIPGQGPQQHPTGFSAPVGKIKGLSEHASQYSIRELKMFLGKKEGDEITIEFESGVVVTGVIEKFTSLTNSADEEGKAAVITFKDKTARVKYGVHTLFAPSWGVFDMLLMPEVSDSNTVAPSAAAHP